jgi:hypothetical protein
VKRLHATLAWRAEEKPDEMFCRACVATPGSHYMHVIGHDVEQRPIIYSCLAMASNRDVAANREHMITCFEEVGPAVDEEHTIACFTPALLSPTRCMRSRDLGVHCRLPGTEL